MATLSVVVPVMIVLTSVLRLSSLAKTDVGQSWGGEEKPNHTCAE